MLRNVHDGIVLRCEFLGDAWEISVDKVLLSDESEAELLARD